MNSLKSSYEQSTPLWCSYHGPTNVTIDGRNTIIKQVHPNLITFLFAALTTLFSFTVILLQLLKHLKLF